MQRLSTIPHQLARLPSALDRRWALGIAGGTFAVGILIAAWSIPSTQPPAARESADSLHRRVAQLEAELETQRDENVQLMAQLAALEGRLAQRGVGALWPGSEPHSVDDGPSNDETGESSSTRPRGRFDEDALVESGLHRSDAEELHKLWEAAEMEKLELTARAAAEGWDRSYRHFSGLRKVDERLREQLDEDTYDRLLYATGRPNRLIVQDVISGSPAALAGIRPGDFIVRYDGQRVFTKSQLEGLAGGARDERIRLELERDGTRLEFFVSNEPLGVLAAVTRHQPGS